MSWINLNFKSFLWKIKDTTIGKYKLAKEKKKILRLINRGLRLGKNVSIMPGVELEAHYCYLLSIGDNSILSTGVRITCHDASMYSYLGFSRIGRVDIGKNCLIGERAIILPGVKIGDNSLIAIGSLVNKDIPANSMVAGNPARIYGKLENFLNVHKEAFKQSPKFDHKYLLKSRYDKNNQEKIRLELKNSDGYSVGDVTKRNRTFD